MKTHIFRHLGEQLRAARLARNLTQPQLASRVGRNQARISELERDLLTGRPGRDRLTLVADICDALDLEPLLIPRDRIGEIMRLLGTARHVRPPGDASSTFDQVFVDLSDFPENDE